MELPCTRILIGNVCSQSELYEVKKKILVENFFSPIFFLSLEVKLRTAVLADLRGNLNPPKDRLKQDYQHPKSCH